MRLSSILAKSTLILPLTSGPCTAQVIGLDIGLALLTSHQWSLYCASDWSGYSACTSHLSSVVLVLRK